MNEKILRVDDDGGFPPDGKQGKAMPIGSRVLKVALDVDALAPSGTANDLALAEMNNRQSWYDPAVLDAPRKIMVPEEAADRNAVASQESR